MSSHPNPEKQQEVVARNVFKKFDEDNSGTIATNEFRYLIEFLGASFSDAELSEAIKEIDEDGSGQLDCEEFVHWWTNKSSSSRATGGLVAMKLRKLANKAMQVFDTDIHTAVWNNDLALVKMFLDIDPRKMSNLPDTEEYGDSMTPLHYASYQGYKDIVLELLRSNANVNIRNRLGFTPLFYASQRGYVDVCRVLVGSGADPTIIGFDEDYPHYALCPVDYVFETPGLESIFRMHENCKEPVAPDIDKVNLTISTSGVATLTLPPLVTISKILVKSYTITLMTVNAGQPPEILHSKLIPTVVDPDDPDRKKKDKKNEVEIVEFKYDRRELEKLAEYIRQPETSMFSVLITNSLGDGPNTVPKTIKILRSTQTTQSISANKSVCSAGGGTSGTTSNSK